MNVYKGVIGMPTYEYECLECKNRFELFQSVNDEPVRTCASCNGRVRKLFSSAGIIFKGSGFYVNDYKNAAGKSVPAAPGEGASCAASGSCPTPCGASSD